jgi:DNA-binding winged helix-turn-helix (wHTH) protein/TolB-like protein
MNLSEQNNILYTADFEVCPELGLITVEDKAIRLGPVNMKVLQVLLENHGQVVSRAKLFEKVWKNQVVSDDTLTRCISDLRGQLGQYVEQLKLIETIPKRGYRWIAKVSDQQLTDRLSYSVQTIKKNSAKTELKQTPQSIPKIDTAKSPKAKLQWKFFAVWLISGIVLLLLLSTSTLWMVNRMVDSDTVRVALLPMLVENKQQQGIATNFEDLLKEQLLATDNIRFLSSRTINGNRQNLYPYLSREFAAQWIIEGRMRGNQGRLKITLNLVDARTALVSQSFSEEIDPSKTNLGDVVKSLITRLEAQLLSD